MLYDCAIVGGGIAGLQAAIQLGRYEHNVIVIDSEDGRSNLCRGYHNLLGWPDGISGMELRSKGKSHAESLGVTLKKDLVEDVQNVDDGFLLSTANDEQVKAKRLLLATGIKDRIPPIPKLIPCLGISVYVCPDCDGYEVKGRKTIVIGSGDVGANMALTLNYWTNEIIYINHEKQPIDPSLADQLKEKNVTYIENEIKEVIVCENDESVVKGFKLIDGENVLGERGFIAFGGNKVKSDLAKQLGVERLENKHIAANARTQETNIKHVWVAGDVVAHSEQVTIAMGEGSQAAIWIHKSLI